MPKKKVSATVVASCSRGMEKVLRSTLRMLEPTAKPLRKGSVVIYLPLVGKNGYRFGVYSPTGKGVAVALFSVTETDALIRYSVPQPSSVEDLVSSYMTQHDPEHWGGLILSIFDACLAAAVQIEGD